jgi:hypothetical protein
VERVIQTLPGVRRGFVERVIQTLPGVEGKNAQQL